MIRLAATVLGCVAVTSQLAGFPRDHGPFEVGQSPPRFPIKMCPLLTSEGANRLDGQEVMIYGDRAMPGRVLWTRLSEDNDMNIEVTDDAQHKFARATFNDGYSDRATTAWCGDLNADRVVDFILPVWSGGNALGGEFAELAVVLSSGATYRVWVVPTFDPDPEDLLALPSSRDAVIVTASLRTEAHSYWVYNLISIRKDELVLANGLDRRFPKWVWFTTQPNHKPASLSASDEQRIWALGPQKPLLYEARRMGQ